MCVVLHLRYVSCYIKRGLLLLFASDKRQPKTLLHFCCVARVLVLACTGIERAGLRNHFVSAFICSGEEWPSCFLGATTRLLDRSMTSSDYPGAGDRHCKATARHRAGRVHQQLLCQLAPALVPLGMLHLVLFFRLLRS